MELFLYLHWILYIKFFSHKQFLLTMYKSTHWINYFFFFNFRKSIFKGKRLNIFAVKAPTEEALETGLLRKEQHYFSCIEKFHHLWTSLMYDCIIIRYLNIPSCHWHGSCLWMYLLTLLALVIFFSWNVSFCEAMGGKDWLPATWI